MIRPLSPKAIRIFAILNGIGLLLFPFAVSDGNGFREAAGPVGGALLFSGILLSLGIFQATHLATYLERVSDFLYLFGVAVVAVLINGLFGTGLALLFRLSNPVEARQETEDY